MQELLENHKKPNCEVCFRRDTRKNLLTLQLNNPYLPNQGSIDVENILIL